MSVYDKLRGTFETLFRIGKGGPQIKNNSGVVEHRNSDDSDFAVVRGDYPLANDDLATKKYVDDNNASQTGCVRMIKFAIAQATPVNSTKQIPASARVLRSRVVITTPYDNNAAITVGSESTAGKLQGAADNDPAAAGTYQVSEPVDWEGSLETVDVVITNSPTVGAGFVEVEYCEPDA